MKQIYVLVEGHSEREFVTRILSPYFGNEGLSISPIPMRKSGGGLGISNVEHFKNHVEPLLHYADAPVITTFIDLFRFPTQSSVHEEEVLLKKIHLEPDVTTRINGFETVLAGIVLKIKPYNYFLPYIQKHEFETLLFSDPNVFDLEDVGIRKDVEAVLSEIPEPEEINSTEKGHPAQRLKDIFAANQRKYNKGVDAVIFTELAGIDTILKKCPRFRTWIETLIAMATK